MSIGVAPFLGANAEELGRMVLLHDSDGRVLLLLPAPMLLNLGAIWTQTGRRLMPITPDDSHKFFSQEALQSSVGQRKLMTMPLLLDEKLLGREQLHIHEPFSGLHFSISLSRLTPLQTVHCSLRPSEHQPDMHLTDETLIGQAVERFTALRVRQSLDETLSLPPMPPTLRKIIELRSDDDADISQLLEIVKLDPSLSAQIMSWAASPYYAAPGKVESLEDAVSRVLGFDLVVNMALASAVGQLLKVPETGPRGATPYWLQSVSTAILAEKLSKRMPVAIRPLGGLAYLAGLLQNFGFLVLAHIFPNQFSVLGRYIEANPHIEPSLIEQQVLHVTREQIGGWLLTSWRLPEPVCQAVRFQNSPERDHTEQAYIDLIRLCNQLLRPVHLADGPIELPATELYERLGLEPEEVSKTVAALLRDYEQLQELTDLLAD